MNIHWYVFIVNNFNFFSAAKAINKADSTEFDSAEYPSQTS